MAFSFLFLGGSSAGAATSAWVSMGTCGLNYRTDANGNRIIDYSYAGYHGGGAALPVVVVEATVTPVAGNNSANIQAAINAVSARPLVGGFRGAVLLQPGTYSVTSPISITASGVILRGSGSGTGGTQLSMSGAAFNLFAITGSGNYAASGTPMTMTASYAPVGTITFTVNSTAGYAVGDTVLVRRLVTQAWVDLMNMNNLVRNGAAQTWIGVGSNIETDRVITAINGNQVTLDVPLTDSFDANYTAGTIVHYSFNGRISETGLEHLSILAPAQNANISTPQYEAMNMGNVMNGWVQDIAVQDTDNSFSVGGGTKEITFSGVTVTHTTNFTQAAGPADFAYSGTQTLFENCASKGNTGVWAFVGQAEATGPNVMLNCFSDARGLSPHQRWSTGSLADNCQFGGGGTGTPGIAYSNRCEDGSGQGWDAGWSVGWNCTSSDFQILNPPGTLNWAIGCIGTEDAPGSCAGSAEVQGTYDSLGTHVTLGSYTSLYLAQLAARQGLLCHTATPTRGSTSTNTPTRTVTLTETNTATLTKTKTNTSTASRTATPSLTATPSPTGTSSATPTLTHTRTMTMTETNTVTSTKTNTNTSTNTATNTCTNTFTSTHTATNTPTNTSTNTPVDTATVSPTNTGTSTPTATLTSSYTWTVTSTSSATATSTLIRTSTPTLSPTGMATATLTLSYTPTFTASLTWTATSTPTWTRTHTPVFTATPSLTPTATVSSTATVSLPCAGIPAWNGNFVAYSLGQEVSDGGELYKCIQAHTSEPNWEPPVVPALWQPLGPCGFTPTVSSSCPGIPAWNGNFVAYSLGQEVSDEGELYKCIQAHTSEPNWEPPVVPALWQALGPCGSTPTAVLAPVVYPNPAMGSAVTLAMPQATSANVTVGIYTVSLRMVRTIQAGNLNSPNLVVTLIDKSGVNLANGLYYFVIQANGRKWTDKVLVLR